MTEQQTPEIQDAAPEAESVVARMNRLHMESVQRQSEAQAAWTSPEVNSIRRMVLEDGNVDWREFVTHCGGILKVKELVDANGAADPGRVIPLVDALFEKYATQEFKGGITMRRGPRNRPYPGLRREEAPRFPGDGEMSAQQAEEALRKAQQTPPRTTARR